MRYSWFLLLAALATCTSQAAEVYQYIDEHGNRVFTDKPPLHVDAEEVRLPDVNRTQMPAVTPGPGQQQPGQDGASKAPYNMLTITDLPEGGTFRANDGNIQVRVNISPRLSLRHKLQLLVDGQPHGAPVRSSLLQASNLDRGEHSLAVHVLAGDEIVQQSADYQVNIQRAHVNAPARRRP